jgi:hypothetical protein
MIIAATALAILLFAASRRPAPVRVPVRARRRR